MDTAPDPGARGSGSTDDRAPWRFGALFREGASPRQTPPSGPGSTPTSPRARPRDPAEATAVPTQLALAQRLRARIRRSAPSDNSPWPAEHARASSSGGDLKAVVIEPAARSPSPDGPARPRGPRSTRHPGVHGEVDAAPARVGARLPLLQRQRAASLRMLGALRQLARRGQTPQASRWRSMACSVCARPSGRWGSAASACSKPVAASR